MSGPMKPIFLSAGLGLWYSTGAQRLSESLTKYHWPGDRNIWINEWPPGNFSRDCVYNVKAAAFQHAIKAGFRTLIWGDASVYAINPIGPMVDHIATHGYWLGQSGHNAAQTCSDACLQYFGVTRDWAETVPDCATGCFGVSLDFPQAKRFIERFIQAGADKAFHGSRFHAGQSKDPRFAFHRQDQSAATIIAAQEGMGLALWQNFIAFRCDKTKPHHIFRCEGM